MGESQNQPFQLSFNRFLCVDFQGSRVTSDGGLLLVRELDERLDLTGLIQNHLVDSRTGRNTQFPLADLFRQSAYSRLAGYEDLNDATRLASDPTLTSLQQRLVKTGGRLVNHARYYWLLLAEAHLNRRLFGNMLRMIAALPLPDG